MEYKQTQETYKYHNNTIRIERTQELQGKVWVMDDVYIVVNGQALYTPKHWFNLNDAQLVRKIEAMLDLKQAA